MDESPSEDRYHEHDDPAAAKLLGNWRSCLLLFVMLLGILATPLAVIYRWNEDRRSSQLLQSQEQAEVNGRIAYITPDGQVATIGPDGANARRLTDAAHGFEFPAWDPEGGRLAAVGGDKVVLIGAGRDSGESILTTELYHDSNESPFYLYWSPDGQYVSFLTGHPDGIALHMLDVDLDGAGDERLAVGQPFYWDWSPNADGLLIHSGVPGANPRLEVIELSGAGTANSFGHPGFFQAPGISPSGRYMAYAALDDDGRSRLVIYEEDGVAQQYEAHAGQLAISWNPAADVLAFKSPRFNSRFGAGPLRLLDPRTGEGALLSNDNVLAFFWSPDGQTIAYFTLPHGDDGNVRVAAADDKERIRARPQRQQGEPQMDLWAVDVASGHQRRLTQFAPTALFVRQFLPFFDQYALSHRIWSPDSQALVIPVLVEGRSMIAVVPLGRAAVRTIADGQIAFWSHQ